MFYEIEYNNEIVYLSIDDPIIKKTYIKGEFHEQRLLESIKISGGTIIDCGACVGNHSIFLSKFTDADKIFAFEPVINNYQYLINNIVKNSIDNIIPLSIGLSNQNKFIGFSLEKQRRWVQAALNGSGNIPTVPLDSFLFENVSLLKIDVEGQECLVLEGGLNTIKKYKPKIYIEAITDKDLSNIMNILNPIGYKVNGNYHKSNPTYYLSI